MHPTTRMRARWHRAAGQHILAGRAPSAAEISAALKRSVDAAMARQRKASRQAARKGRRTGAKPR